MPLPCHIFSDFCWAPFSSCCLPSFPLTNLPKAQFSLKNILILLLKFLPTNYSFLPFTCLKVCESAKLCCILLNKNCKDSETFTKTSVQYLFVTQCSRPLKNSFFFNAIYCLFNHIHRLCRSADKWWRVSTCWRSTTSCTARTWSCDCDCWRWQRRRLSVTCERAPIRLTTQPSSSAGYTTSQSLTPTKTTLRRPPLRYEPSLLVLKCL